VKRVPDPGKGRRWNAANPPLQDKDMVSIAESHEEHLLTSYPHLETEIQGLKAAKLPASFHISPGHVTGMRLVQLGVPGICPHCGMFESNPNPKCKQHPENSGGGVTHGSWQRRACESGLGAGTGG
jgi:hypothetical protein